MKVNNIGYFEIHSSDPGRDINFYKSLFGWTFTRDENIDIEYYRVNTGNLTGGLLKRGGNFPSPATSVNAFVNSVQVGNFDQVMKQVISLGGKISIEKFAVPGRCWQGYFLDPDNNCFGIFEVDPAAK